MLEVVWTRQLRLVFGTTTLAISTILVSYMAGLGIGGYLGGRLSTRVRDGVRAYGLIEIAVGLYALAVPAIFAVFPWLGRGWLEELSFWPAALVRFALALAVLMRAHDRHGHDPALPDARASCAIPPRRGAASRSSTVSTRSAR